MEGSYIINGDDLFIEYGFIAGADRKTSNSFLIPNEVKPFKSVDLSDINGVLYYQGQTEIPLPRTFVLDGTIIAEDENDFWSKYYAFVNFIRASPTLEIYVGELTQYFAARRKSDGKSFTRFDRLTRIKGGDKVVCAVTVELTEILEFELPENPPIPITYLHDLVNLQDGSFLQ